MKKFVFVFIIISCFSKHSSFCDGLSGEKNHFYFFKVQLYWLKENCTKKIDIWIVGNKKNGKKKYSFFHIFFVFFLFCRSKYYH